MPQTAAALRLPPGIMPGRKAAKHAGSVGLAPMDRAEIEREKQRLYAPLYVKGWHGLAGIEHGYFQGDAELLRRH